MHLLRRAPIDAAPRRLTCEEEQEAHCLTCSLDPAVLLPARGPYAATKTIKLLKGGDSGVAVHSRQAECESLQANERRAMQGDAARATTLRWQDRLGTPGDAATVLRSGMR